MVPGPGWIVVLNGAPRSGKSSIVEVIQDSFEGPWMSLGVDVASRHMTPPHLRPGIGLRPGGERPEIEAMIPSLYAALYESVAAHSRHGLNVVVDVGHHDAYSTPLHILRDAAVRLRDLPAFLVAVHCPIEVIMERRNDARTSGAGHYVAGTAADPVPLEVRRWQEEVHAPGIYDLELDTSDLTPVQSAQLIRDRLGGLPPRAFGLLAEETP
jgi:chloramphenicol 3-O phosphotransferase